MRLLALFLVVGVVAIFQMYAAVPIGLAGNLDRGSIIISAWIGGMIGVIALVYAGPVIVERGTALLRRIFRRPPKEPDSAEEADAEPGWVRRYAERLGAPFLGIVGPMTIGGFAAAILGSSLGMGRWKLIAWLGVGQAIVIVAYTWTLKEVT